MNKKFTKLMAALALLVFMTPSLAGWGQTRTEEVYSTCLFGEAYDNQTHVNNYTSTWEASNGSFSWTIINGNAGYQGGTNPSWWNYVKFGSKNAASVGQITTTTDYSVAVTKVVLTIDAVTASNVNSIKLYSGTSANSITTEEGSFTVASGAQTVTISSPAVNKYYDIKFDCNKSSNGVVTVSKVEYYHDNSGGNTPTHSYSLNITGADDDAEVALYVDGEELGADDEIAEGKTVTVSVNPSEGYTYSVAVKDADNADVEYDEEMDSFTMPDSDVTITVTTAAIPTHTITFNAGSGTCGTSSQTHYEGTVITEFPTATPSAACASNGWTFVGWATASANNLTSNPTISSYEVTGTATLYAVYKLETAAPFDNTEGGEFKIYANVSGTKYYAIGGVSNKRLESTTDSSLATSYTFEKQSEGVYKINDGSNYIGSSGSADLNTNETSWTIESSNSNYGSWKVWANSGRALLFRTNSYNYFKNFSTASIGSEYFYLDFEGGSATYATSPSCTQTYTITLNQNTGGTIEADYATAEAGQTITLSYNLDDCYTFDSWTILDGSAETVTVTNNQFTMPDSNVEVEGIFTQKAFTMSYSVNGVVYDVLEESVDCGENALLYSASDLDGVVTLPSGCSLLGWSTSANSTTTVGSFTPTTDATLYAVLRANSSSSVYELVTSASQISEGTYLFAALRAETLPQTIEYSIATGEISSGDLMVTEEKYAPTNNTFATIPTGGVEFELTGNNTDGFVISYGSTSLGYTSNNSRKLAFGEYDAYLWKFYDKEGGLSTGAVYMQNYRNYVYYTVSENSTATGAIRGYSGQTKYRGFYLFKKSEGSAYTLVKEISSAETLSSIEETYLVTVKNGGVLTLTGPNNGDETNLTIADGGQLVTNSAVNATVKKEISGFGSDNTVQTGWYTIASPVTSNITPAGAMLQNTYDLFYYDEADTKWYNYKPNNAHSGFDLAPNTGYLYANSANTTLSFAGEVRASNASVSIPLSYASSSTNQNLKGFNLVGNPFVCNITSTTRAKLGDANFTAYYIADGTLNNNGENLIAYNVADRPIKPGEGFFVQASAANQSLAFNVRGRSEQNGYIRITAGNESFTDRAYVQFGDGNTLRKMTLSDNTAKVFVMQDNNDFAAVVIEEAQGEMPVNFKATENGTYTLSVNPEGVELNYLHLIDNMTGMDIDLLANPSYTFDAKTTDYESRFRLVFAANSEDGVSTGSTTFAFFSNGNWIVSNEGEATLQVIDLNGRIVSSETINGTVATSLTNTPGIYMLRLVNGNEVKTQKVVVK